MFLSQIIAASPPYQSYAAWSRCSSLKKNVIKAAAVTAAVAVVGLAVLVLARK